MCVPSHPDDTYEIVENGLERLDNNNSIKKKLNTINASSKVSYSKNKQTVEIRRGKTHQQDQHGRFVRSGASTIMI